MVYSLRVSLTYDCRSHGELLVYPSIPDISDHEVEMVCYSMSPLTSLSDCSYVMSSVFGLIQMVEDIEALGPLEHSGFTDDHHLEDWENLRDEELAMKRREYVWLTTLCQGFLVRI